MIAFTATCDVRDSHKYETHTHAPSFVCRIHDTTTIIHLLIGHISHNPSCFVFFCVYQEKLGREVVVFISLIHYSIKALSATAQIMCVHHTVLCVCALALGIIDNTVRDIYFELITNTGWPKSKHHYSYMDTHGFYTWVFDVAHFRSIFTVHTRIHRQTRAHADVDQIRNQLVHLAIVTVFRVYAYFGRTN